MQRFGITVQVNDNRDKMRTRKSGAVVKMEQFICLGQGSHRGMMVLSFFRGGGGYQLLFAIAMKCVGLLVNGNGAKAEINHLSELRKEEDKESEYGELLFHACLKIII